MRMYRLVYARDEHFVRPTCAIEYFRPSRAARRKHKFFSEVIHPVLR